MQNILKVKSQKRLVYITESEFRALRKDSALWEETKEYVNEFLGYLNTESKKAQKERITTE
ncbi:hypothetical protein [uncultured Helicobacter sp.]|uniref:hypothetical protein n=1 Tax=uncultured Helicobacter sp. TaxID=175537 RepID=UPI002623B0DB|nr:hypothetical protein [uncultured Helicobacter sp.]